RSWESSVLSLSFPSPRRSLSRCSGGQRGGAYFSLIKSVTFGNRPYRWWLLSERVFFEGGVPAKVRLKGQECRCHRHRTGLTRVRLFETACLREAEAASRRRQ